MPIFPAPLTTYTSASSSLEDAKRSTDHPETRSPARFLVWLLSKQWPLLAAYVFLYFLYYSSGMLLPLFTGRAIDEGILAGRIDMTLRWSLIMIAVIAVGVVADLLAHTSDVASFLVAMYRVMGLAVRKIAQMGHVQTRRFSTGEMMSVASSDAEAFGALADVTGRTITAALTVIAVSFLMLTESITLGVIVLIATPLIVFSSAPLMRPLYTAQAKERERSSRLTGMAADIVSGLRILRGIGGEQTFGDNYTEQSQKVRRASVQAGGWASAVVALNVLLTGLLLVVLAWFGTREFLAGRLRIGQLISFFGYAVFLVQPLQTFIEATQRWTHGLVSARKTIAVFAQEPVWPQVDDAPEWTGGRIHDENSGFIAEEGELTIIVSATPDESATLADRLGRYLPPEHASTSHQFAQSSPSVLDGQGQPGEATNDETTTDARWGVSVGGVDLSYFEVGEVRRRIVVNDAASAVFSGTLQELIDPLAAHTRHQAEEALWTASAEDVWETLPEGWQGHIDERGRGLSGGQRQRLVLARALLADPEILILVEPTSAVDAHTEARIAERLSAHRKGKTTIVTTTSPLWLQHADRIALLRDGCVIAIGSHRELLANNDAYRTVVKREADR